MRRLLTTISRTAFMLDIKIVGVTFFACDGFPSGLNELVNGERVEHTWGWSKSK